MKMLKRVGIFPVDQESITLFENKLVDCLEKCLIYGHIRRVAD